MKQNELKFFSGITDVHLHDVVRFGISEMKSNILLRSKYRPNLHINKVSLGYFCCNGQFFCFCYDVDIGMLRLSSILYLSVWLTCLKDWHL
jgi:hypothetical protein